jgi:hypothetical protein
MINDCGVDFRVALMDEVGKLVGSVFYISLVPLFRQSHFSHVSETIHIHLRRRRLSCF